MQIDSKGTLFNTFLSILQENKPEENLEKLKDWFESRLCVGNAEITCNSCLDTHPTQSEISINFIPPRESINRITDISMSEPLRFIRYLE